MSVTLTQVKTDLSYLLGESSVPSSGIEDRERFIQIALERAYRAYNFPFNKLTATVQAVNGVATLPSGMMQDGSLDIRNKSTSPEIQYRQINYDETDTKFAQGQNTFYLDGYAGTYVAYTSETNTSPVLTVRYTTAAPVINASIATPFPSSMALARGALIYYRQAEDPQADISQEENVFRLELNEIIASYNRNRPRRRMVSAQEANGTYTGDTGDRY